MFLTLMTIPGGRRIEAGLLRAFGADNWFVGQVKCVPVFDEANVRWKCEIAFKARFNALHMMCLVSLQLPHGIK